MSLIKARTIRIIEISKPSESPIIAYCKPEG